MTKRHEPVDRGQGWDDGSQIGRVTEDDGTVSEVIRAELQGYDSANLVWRRVKVDSTGAIATTGAAGGGGAATIADGADVAQGTTTDLSSANTVIGILKAIKAAIQGTLTTSVSNFPATQPVSLATNTPDVTDRAARLVGHVTVDNASLAVTMATQTPDVTDRAARLLGVVDKGKVWDGTNIAAVKAASALAAATDPALVVQHSPQRADASTLVATTISGANATVTLTIPAAAAGLFHYITSIEIIATNPTVTAIAAAATNLAWSTTNLNGLAWNAGTLLAAGAEKVITRFSPATPIKSAAAATNSTIVAPAVGAGGLCRIQVTYYTAP